MPTTSRRKRALRLAALVGFGLALWFVGRPAAFLTWVVLRDRSAAVERPAGSVNDASGLESAEVVEVVTIPRDRDAAIATLRALLARAARERLAVSIAGSRHSMGGHTIAAGGLVASMSEHDAIAYDEVTRALTVGAGATWADVLAFLDPLGLSVAVMQSNDSFTVGGSLSVNCHGWQHGRPPIAATVRSLRLMLADGRLIECSRVVEPELFSLVLGGYGLFGVILDAELDVVPNERYRRGAAVVPADRLGPLLQQRANDSRVGLALGRYSIDPDDFMGEAVLKTYVRIDDGAPVPAMAPLSSSWLRRAIFRGSVGSDYGKGLRWSLERRFGTLAGGATTRNSELAEPVSVYANGDRDKTELLFEAFVPQASLEAYRLAIAPLIEASPCNLLNITVRDVRVDETSFLRYADRDMFSLVMLFHLERTVAADAELAALTRQLIDAALALGGRYYLPYRRHATLDQFERAYPMAREFLAAKLRYDPEERFRSRFYDEYIRR